MMMMMMMMMTTMTMTMTMMAALPPLSIRVNPRRKSYGG
jgi:hypothetical protein